VPFDLTAFGPRVREHAEEWNSLGLDWSVDPIHLPLVAGRSAPKGDIPDPRSDVANGFVRADVGDGERETYALSDAPVLAVEVRLDVVWAIHGRDRSDERDQRI